MKITVTTSSQTFEEILSDNQEAQIKLVRNGPLINFLIQNLHATSILYIDFGAAAAVATGLKIVPGQTYNFSDINLNECNLIADVENNDIRIIAT